MHWIDSVVTMLRARRAGIVQAIDALEAMRSGNIPDSVRRAPGRRGRKFMSAAERREVSARMKRYWAQRKRTDASEQTARVAQAG